MGDVNITISTRFLERLIYWVIIVALAISLIVVTVKYQSLEDGGSTITTQDDTPDTTTTDSDDTDTDNASQDPVFEPECTADVDCEIGSECVDQECVQVDEPPECNLHSDCLDKGELYKCRDNECVFEPECELDDDCDSGYECNRNQCEEIPLSGEVEVEVTDIEYIYDNEMENTRLESFDLTITNGLDEDLDYTAMIWFLGDSQRFNIGESSWKYGFEYGNDLNEIDLPTIEVGETYTRKIELTHNGGDAGGNWPLGGIDDTETAYFEIRFYEDRDYNDDDFDPADTSYEYFADDWDI